MRSDLILTVLLISSVVVPLDHPENTSTEASTPCIKTNIYPMTTMHHVLKEKINKRTKLTCSCLDGVPRCIVLVVSVVPCLKNKASFKCKTM